MATSPIYNWPEPDNTDLVKNGALAIRTLGNAIDTTMATMVPKTIVDAKGDLIAATAADTVSRLAIGSNNQVLTADSTAATGMKWAAAAGGNLTLTQIASGTLSGANLTISGITQDTIVVQINNPTWSSFNRNVYARFNGDSGNNYVNSSVDQTGGTTNYDFSTASAPTDAYYGNRGDFGNGTGALNYFLVVTNAKAAGKTLLQSKCWYLNSSSAKAFCVNNGMYLPDAQITSLTWLSGSTLTGGTYTVWGG
jgi:hypothetical protein